MLTFTILAQRRSPGKAELYAFLVLDELLTTRKRQDQTITVGEIGNRFNVLGFVVLVDDVKDSFVAPRSK